MSVVEMFGCLGTFTWVYSVTRVLHLLPACNSAACLWGQGLWDIAGLLESQATQGSMFQARTHLGLIGFKANADLDKQFCFGI